MPGRRRRRSAPKLKRFATFLLAHRPTVLIAIGLCTAFFGYHAARLRMATDFGALLPQGPSALAGLAAPEGQPHGANSLIIMVESAEGSIFTVDTLTKIWNMTAALGRIPGIDASWIESIAAPSTRILKVAAGGTLRPQVVMAAPPEIADQAEAIRRAVRNSAYIHGQLVSLDDSAALLRVTLADAPRNYGHLLDAINETVVAPFLDAQTAIVVAGQPVRFGAAYRSARHASYLFGAAALVLWMALALYYRDWRGLLHPTLSTMLATVWGLGAMRLVGLTLDPFTLLIPFVLALRAYGHAVQAHDRYCEALTSTDHHTAIIDTVGAAGVPTVVSLLADTLGLVVLMFVPVPFLQQLAIAGGCWLGAVLVGELIVNPIILSYVAPPRVETADLLEISPARQWERSSGVERLITRMLSPLGRRLTLAAGALTLAIALWCCTGLAIGEEAGTASLLSGGPIDELTARRIRDKFGGVEALVVVAEGYAADALKDPPTLRRVERLQRHLERDPVIGASLSLADVARSLNMAFHELEPKWEVFPSDTRDAGGLFSIFFTGALPADTAQWVDPSYAVSPVRFRVAGVAGDDIRRIMREYDAFVATAALEELGIAVDGAPGGGVLVTAVHDVPRWKRAGDSWVVSRMRGDLGPFRVGDRIRAIDDQPVSSVDSFGPLLVQRTAASPLPELMLERGGQSVTTTVSVPWRAVFRVGGGLIGVLAAANAALPRIECLMYALALATILSVLTLALRSFVAAVYVLLPLLLANAAVYAYLATAHIGLTIHLLPILAVGVGLGIQAPLALLDRTRIAMRANGDLDAAVRHALTRSGRTVAFTAASLIAATLLWWGFGPRFDAALAVLGVLWVGISSLGAVTLLPAALLTLRPRFLVRIVSTR